MKNLLHLTALISILFLAGCEKEPAPPAPPIDPRDAIVGTYSETGSGVLTVTANGQSSSIPWSVSSLVASISKSGQTDVLFFSEQWEKSILGSVSGSLISISPFIYTDRSPDGTMILQLTVVPTLNISGTTIYCSYSCNGTVSSVNASASVTGTINTVLSKR